MLGIVFGNLLPDADNLAVGVATVMKVPTEGLPHLHPQHFHGRGGDGLFLSGRCAGQTAMLGQPGCGAGVGILMHIGSDLLLWFNGVADRIVG